ncbi:MAG: ADP-ribosylglycohydrolase family protein [Phycisphaerales bacterium]|nr:ADP-ribosylglycohydrolase family protein [Phycisphaerales bacterium]
MPVSKSQRDAIGPNPALGRAALEGFLLGTAVGDAIGLPFEGLPPSRVHRRLGNDPLGHSLILRRGLLSDDTEHACMTVRAVMNSRGDPQTFVRELRWRLKWWFAALPPGVGLATSRACLRMWAGCRPERCGVFSAGNGPVMRAGVLGLLCSTSTLNDYIVASTELTHTDPRACEAALFFARWTAASVAATRHDPVPLIEECVRDEELRRLMLLAVSAAIAGQAPEAFAAAMGLSTGVSGFVNHTAPVCLFLSIRYADDFRSAISAAIRLGGDTDTVAAITGGIIGARVGAMGIPGEWIDGIIDWPRSVAWLRRLAEFAADPDRCAPERLFWPAIPVRNLAMLSIVLGHGFRRLVPC